MQQTQNYQTAAGAVTQMAPVTVIHFALIALCAVLAVIVIIVGARLAHRRHAAQDEAAERQQEVVGSAPETPAPAPATPLQAPPAAAAPAAAALPSEAPTIETNAAPVTGDLTRLKGLGPKIATALDERGIRSIADLARLSPDEAARLDGDLGSFAGRLSRDRWVEQARLLDAGDVAGYERAFGKLG